MKDKRRQKFVSYVKYLKDELHLKDWSFIIADERPRDNDAIASIFLAYGRKIFTLYFSEQFLYQNREEQRHTIIHELIHAHMAIGCDFASDQLDQRLKNVFVRMIEYGVDGLTDAIAKHYKLP